jgi:hypothetical protein
VIQPGAKVRANATDNGNGGRVVVQSNLSTSVGGAISATGGPDGGDGGFVETSTGGMGFALTATPDLSAPRGAPGTWLLDPFNLTLSDAQPAGSTVITLPAPSGGTQTILATDPPATGVAWLSLANLNSATANVDIRTTNDLLIANSGPTANAIALGSNSLSLTAGHNISIDRGITIASGPLTMSSGTNAGIVFGTTIGSSPGVVTAATPAIQVNTSSLSLNAGTAGIALVDTRFGTAITPVTTLTLAATGGGVSQAASGAILATTLQTAGSVSGNVSLIGSSNAVANLGSLAVTGGDFQLVNAGTLNVSSAVSANNIFILNQPVGPNKAISFANTGSLIAANNGTISLVTDALSATAGASIKAATGTVEIAPASLGTTVGVISGGGLTVGAPVLAAITTGTLRLGGYEDAINASANTVTAGSIDIGGPTDLQLGHTIATNLRLDTAQGPVTESGGPLLNAGTFAASTNSTAISPAASITLDKANTIGNLGNVAVGNGDFTLVNNTGLALPGGSTVYGNNVTITNAGTVTIGGNLAAATGTLQVSALGGSDIAVSGTALIGAATSATIAAGGNFTQSGGIVNAPTLAMSAGGDFTQSSGTIAALSTAAGVGLTITANGTLGESGAGGAITSNNDMTATGTAGINLASGSVIAMGNLTFNTAGGFVSGGTVASGNTLSFAGPGPTSILQSGGLIGATNAVLLITPGTATQAGGIVAATNPTITAGAMGLTPFQMFGGAITVTPGSTVVSMVTSGASTPNPPGSLPGGSTPLSLPNVVLGTGRPHHLIINVTSGDYDFNKPLNADWVEIHTPGGNTTENSGGTVTADLLTGSAGGDALFMQSGNQVTWLAGGAPISGGGPGSNSYVTVGDFELRDGIPLMVGGPVQVGPRPTGSTLELLSPGLTIDQSGTVIPPIDGLSFATSGSLQATAGTSTAGGITTVTPGRILLQADTIAGLPAIAGSILVSAPDGMVEIAPLSVPSLSIDIASSGTPSNLSLTDTFLRQIKTIGTTAGTAGTQTLVLGSIDDGATTLATPININTNVDLTGFDRTLQLNAIGTVQEFGNSVTVTALTGKVGNLLFQTGTNTIAEIGNVADRIALGVHYQSKAALTDFTSGQDVKLNDTGAAALTAVGTVTAGTPLTQQGTIDLIARSTTIDSLTNIAGGGIADNKGMLIANAATASAGGTLTVHPGLIRLDTDALFIESSNVTPIVSAPAGEVAITPLTPGKTMSIDPGSSPGTGPSNSATNLSLLVGDLALIDTIGGIALGVTPGPTGTQTLALSCSPFQAAGTENLCLFVQAVQHGRHWAKQEARS